MFSCGEKSVRVIVYFACCKSTGIGEYIYINIMSIFPSQCNSVGADTVLTEEQVR